VKVITFSRQFPATHPKKGEPTQFVEKILLSLIEIGHISTSRAVEIGRSLSLPGFENMNELRQAPLKPKHHTIRAGCRWKEGDQFSPRIWSGRPYASKQIEFVYEVDICKVWSFDIARGYIFINRKCFGKFHPLNIILQQLAANDGVEPLDMIRWFAAHPKAKQLKFSGQILCWNPVISYLPQNL
jgi:hypothetical protein